MSMISGRRKRVQDFNLVMLPGAAQVGLGAVSTGWIIHWQGIAANDDPEPMPFDGL